MTIVEVRPPWNLSFHEYDRKRPTKNVQVLLDCIADSGGPIFWGYYGRMERWMIAKR